MAEQNPIKYSDLIVPDDSIETLVKQLDEANDAYSNLANNIKAEAQRMATSLQMVSGATSTGRSTIRGMSQDAEKLLKAERDLNFARSETARKIAELNAAKKLENSITKLNVQLANASEGSYKALSAQYALNKIRLNEMTEAERRNTEEGRKLEAETRDLYDRMNELQKATGKYSLEVGNYEKAVGQLMGVQGQWMQNLQMLQGLFAGGLVQGLKTAGSAVAAFGKQLLALMANPIVATIAAIAAAFMALSHGISSSEENTRALERIMAPFQRVLTAVTNVLQTAAGLLLKCVEGMENMAMATSRLLEKLPLVGKYIKQQNDALQENINLTREQQRLKDLNRQLTKDEAKKEYEIAVLRRKANQTDNPKERAALLGKAVRKEKEISDARVAMLQRELAVMKAKAKQSQNDAATNDAIAQKEAEIWRAKTQAEQRSLRMIGQITKANNKMNASRTGGGNTTNTVETEKKVAEQKIAIAQKTQDIRISMLEDEFAREYQTIEVNYNRQIQALRKKWIEEKALRAQIDEQIKAIEEKKNKDLADLVMKYAKKDEEAIAKVNKEKEQAQQAVYTSQVAIINSEGKLRELEIGNMQASEEKKTQLRLQAERERLQKIYDLNVQAGKDINSLEMRILKEQIKGIENQTQKGGFNLFDFLGFNLSDKQKEGITSSFTFATQQLNDYLTAWVQAADAKAQLAEKEVDRAQSVLEAEMEARNKGYASDVEGARKELELAKKTQEEALREREKAQKAQLIIDSISQASNLVSASALIWSQLGFPWAIPALAVMWGSFAAAKIKAVEMTQAQNETYGEGTVELLEGGSHQSGNDIDLGRKKDGTRRRAEGGEFFAVINKRNSRKYRDVIPDVINRLNNGTFADKYMNAYDGGAIMVQAEQKNSDLTRLSDDVHSIREQGERTTYIDNKGRMVVCYKNVKRIITN